MATFNSPPGWPRPPTPDWQPPPGWKPDRSWPPAPPGWSFWLNSRGVRARGPSGRYGADPPGKLIAAWVAGGIALVTIVGAAIGGSNSVASTARSAAPGPTVTTTVPGPTVTVTATVEQPVPGPTATITQPPLPARTVTVKAPRATITITKRTSSTESTTPGDSTAPDVYYENCSEARAAGDTPLYVGDPGYDEHLDRDHDGVACE